MPSLKRLVREGRRLRSEWVNKVTGRDPKGDYDTYYTKFDKDDAEVKDGRWVWKFNRRVLIKPDGTMLGVPKALQGKEPKNAEVARRLFRFEGTDAESATEMIQKLRWYAEPEDNWRKRRGSEEMIKSIEGDPEILRAVSEHFGKHWRSVVGKGAELERFHNAYGSHDLRKALTASSKTKAEADATRALIMSSDKARSKMRTFFGGGWEKAMDFFLEHGQGKTTRLVDNTPMTTASDRLFKLLEPYVDVHNYNFSQGGYHKSDKRTNIRRLHKVMKEAGGFEALRKIVNDPRSLPVGQAVVGLFGRNWIDRVLKDKFDGLIKSMKKEKAKDSKGAAYNWFQVTHRPEVRRALSERMSQFMSDDEFTEYAVYSNQSDAVLRGIQKKLIDMFKPPWGWDDDGPPDFKQIQRYIEDGDAMRNAAEAGEASRARRARDWEEEATYKKRLKPDAYHQQMAETEKSIQRLVTKKGAGEAVDHLYDQLVARGKSKLPHKVEFDSSLHGERLSGARTGLDLVSKFVPQGAWGPAYAKRRVVSKVSPEAVEATVRIQGKRGRGHCATAHTADPNIDINNWGSEEAATRVMMHELGHYLEYSNGCLGDATAYFLEKRTKGQPTVTLMDHEKCVGFRSGEISVPDDFSSSYIGKIYKEHRVSEVISMGLQHFQDKEHARELHEKDPELFALMIAIFRGKFGFRE